jgi:hypothetical protein
MFICVADVFLPILPITILNVNYHQLSTTRICTFDIFTATLHVRKVFPLSTKILNTDFLEHSLITTIHAF